MASPTPLTFRLATPSDAPLLQPLVQSAYRGDSSRQGWTTEADLLAGERISVSGVLSKITTPNSAVLIGTDPSGTLTACCEVVKRSDDVAYFGMFAVDPKRQAGGFGRQVLNYAEKWVVREWGVKRMEMSVIWTRVELIAWYGRRGYRVTGEKGEFPYHELEDGGKALKEDLHFEILEKVLVEDVKGGIVDEKVVVREEVVVVAA
ncbi:acyl-CoA N-acyltransferase [Podospora aff. communis PSN243]|uniref:Acyl-CoA N-acyltransferase n=1 Tax=Podospora aff. communis PSN243 TaxID=3040156 RepID=A0AAV9GN94_9PEZI|nr:acyl-CoA N-acyltransferase [Podospora aff. communis PSN243]